MVCRSPAINTRFSNFVKAEGKALFDLVMKLTVFVDASVLATYGYPSVLAVAEQSEELIEKTET